MTNQQKAWEQIKTKKIVSFDELFTCKKERDAIANYISALKKANIVSFTRKNGVGRGIETITLLKELEKAPHLNCGILRIDGEEIKISKSKKLLQPTKEKLLKDTIKIILDNDSDKFRVGDIFMPANLYKRWIDLLEFNGLILFESRYRNSRIFKILDIEKLKKTYENLLHVRDWRTILEEKK